jgi:tetratricopeptide (TPR) repeat protein
LEQESFQSLLAKLQPVLANMRETTEAIVARLEELYSSGHYKRPITGEDIGDQRADDLIDSAVEEEDSKRKVQLLRRALRYGKTGVLASKAYLVLGMTYEDLGNTKLAIRHYTNSMEAWKPFATAFFFRGGVYFQLEEWEKAHSDFEQALACEEGLDSAQREELEQYMARILEARNV